jgi:hypothetical protein
MVSANSPEPELLRLESLRDMLASTGPCITILLSPFRPGEPAGSPAAVLKSHIQEAARQLAERALPQSVSADLLQPLEALSEDPALGAGTQWPRAIFRSPSVFELFHLTQPVQPSLSVGSSFGIRKLAPELARPRVFYILALSKEGVSLVRCAGVHAELTKLPPRIPATLAEAMSFEPPDHDLENRSASGSSTGAMHGVRFGTGSGRETKHAHLADYYKLVDRGLQEFIREPDTPLILWGVEEDIDIFRAVSDYSDLAQGSIVGSPDVSFLQQADMLRQAYSILRTEELERQAAALAAAKERTTSSRFSTDPNSILRAAVEGRVGQLYVDESAERIDVFKGEAFRSWGREDLLNLAAVQTIIHHGKSCELPSTMMPDGSIAIALMRF